MDLITEAQEFLGQLAQSVREVSGQLDDNFIHAAQAIHHAKGRLIVSGVGKSGHIARKIAATFSSLGTSAHFIHPTEASHGDLGAIARGDVLLAISKSGESVELGNILNYAKANAIPIIGLCAQADSMLGRISDFLIKLSNQPEAGAINVAPTTSTLQSLALGDALAMAVVSLQGFTKHDFSRLHPGGALGLQLMLVEKIMSTDDKIPLVKHNSSLIMALKAMDGKKFGCIGAVNTQDQLTGMMTDGDLRRHLGQDFQKLTMAGVMTANPMVCTAHCLAVEVLQKMNERNINAMFVVDSPAHHVQQLLDISENQRKVIGIIHIHDIFRSGIIL